MALITYKSSAGSGKTSTLVIEYLSIALRNPNKFRHIIALTFTQKATSEMKERLLEILVSLKKIDINKPLGSIEYVVKSINEKTGFKTNEIINRSNILLSNILHNYSDFGFSTIDSFVVRIVKSFAHDLKLSSNFEIELDSSTLIEEAINQINELIGKNKDITKFMIDYTKEQLDNEKSPNLDLPLGELGRLIFDSKHYKNIDALKGIDLKNFIEIKTELIKRKQLYNTKIENFGKEGIQCIEDSNLKKGDCSSKWLWNYFNKLKTNPNSTFNIEKLETKTFINKIENNDDWYAKSKDKSTIALIESAKEKLSKIISKAREYYKTEATKQITNDMILKKITPLALIYKLKQIIEANYEENDIIHISELNRKISEVVNEQHAPFIYERIGQRYNHFLIDEFQDTSVIQWNNMLPLIDNSLASNFRNLLVGDTKQSIYRWRDGEVEQFAQLPNLLGDEHSTIRKQRESLIKSMYEEIPLNTNYRSLENIVNFNNEFFTELLKNEGEYVNNYFQGHIQNTFKEFNSGSVIINNIIKNADSESRYEDLIKAIINNILELKNKRKYNYGDICILARKNKFLSTIADVLIENNINVVSSDALYLKSSKTINIIINFMNILISNNTQINAYSILRYFYNKHNLGEPKTNITDINTLIEEINKLDYSFDISLMENMDAYELSEFIINNLKLKNTSNPFIFNFLDKITELSKQKGASISQFLEYWEIKKDKLNINLSGDSNAVQLLTIHKAKGLEFPIVIFPIIQIDSDLKDRDVLWGIPDDEIKAKIPKVLIGDSKIGLESEFSNIVGEEKNRKELDAMNMIYVACTRPTEQLQLYFTDDKESQKYWKTITNINWNSNRVEKNNNDIIQLGKLTINASKEEAESNNIEINSFISSFWKNNIKLQRDINTNKAIRDKGTQLHNLLAIINSSSNIADIIKNQIERKQLSTENSIEFKQIINDLFSNNDTKGFFSTKYNQLNEKEILTKEGSTFRPDKLIEIGDEVIVIDYKYANIESLSEKEKIKYAKQVNNYKEIISKIYNKNCNGYLLYLNPIFLEKV